VKSTARDHFQVGVLLLGTTALIFFGATTNAKQHIYFYEVSFTFHAWFYYCRFSSCGLLTIYLFSPATDDEKHTPRFLLLLPPFI
jgi:hypothetical protein